MLRGSLTSAAKEHVSFMKYAAMHDLKERHGVDLGLAYKNRDSAANFVHFIAESQRQYDTLRISGCHFYSVLMDGSTDKGRIENELLVIISCKKDDALQEVFSCA